MLLQLCAAPIPNNTQMISTAVRGSNYEQTKQQMIASLWQIQLLTTPGKKTKLKLWPASDNSMLNLASSICHHDDPSLPRQLPPFISTRHLQIIFHPHAAMQHQPFRAGNCSLPLMIGLPDSGTGVLQPLH